MQLDLNQTGERTGKILKRIVSMEDFDILPSNPWATFDVYIWILKNDPLFKFLGMRVKKNASCFLCEAQELDKPIEKSTQNIVQPPGT